MGPPEEHKDRQQVPQPMDEDDFFEDYSVLTLADDTSVTPIQPLFSCCACSSSCTLFRQIPQEVASKTEREVVRPSVRQRRHGKGKSVAEMSKSWSRVQHLEANESLPSVDSSSKRLSHQEFIDICEEFVYDGSQF